MPVPSWPALTTPADVEPAWAVLPEVAAHLGNVTTAWHEAFPGTLHADYFTESTPSGLLHVVGRLLALPDEVEPVLEPVDLARLVNPDPFRAFWANRRGVGVLRAQRTGQRPSKAALRALSGHVNRVLLPEMGPQWRRWGSHYAYWAMWEPPEDRRATPDTPTRVAVRLRG